MNSGVMILAGGTGGHIYPALAVAERLREHGVSLCWLGSEQDMEAGIVPRHGIPFSAVRVRGLRGRGPCGWLLAPLTMGFATLQAVRVLLRTRPRVVLGMGGFVSGPGGLAAWLCRRPLVIHEQNAVPGLTNRLLGRIATRVLAAYPGSFGPAVGARVTGNPVRESIAAIEPPDARLRGDGPVRVLVMGGSRGAHSLNRGVPAALAASAGMSVEVWHQTGAADLVETAAAYRALSLDAQVAPFIDDMTAAYRWADLVVCRAGAITIAELAAAGVAAVLVPYPHAVDDHQTANARYLADAGAAVLLSDTELAAGGLAPVLDRLLRERARLLEMAKRARALARPDAADTVARECMELMHAQD
jgi:UDP-N-acetylglucosamine--N-acetylmuramyl-(pentapeptide) pyrophosphoryl-undecaprenol N-acetylglucosamine transferase